MSLRYFRKLKLRSTAVAIAATVLLLIIGLIGAEGLARVYVYYVVEKGKLFQPDATLGWIVEPNLDMDRRNANGEIYHIKTDAQSIRGPGQFPSSDDVRRMLVIGDSFAFGQGVNLEDRFDSVLTKLRPEIAVLNLGVPGYGTDQELLRAREKLSLLRPGDTVLIVFTTGNDFHDVARTHHSGRSKPWYELSGNTLIRHDPHIGVVERLRDQSYIFSVFARYFESDPPDSRVKQSIEIIEKLLSDFYSEMKKRKITLVLCIQGSNNPKTPFPHAQVLKDLCQYADRCFDLDPLLKEEGMLLKDAHWSAAGHLTVGRFLANHL